MQRLWECMGWECPMHLLPWWPPLHCFYWFNRIWLWRDQLYQVRSMKSRKTCKKHVYCLVHTHAHSSRCCVDTHRTAIMPVCTKQTREAALMDSVSTDTVNRYLIFPRPPRATLSSIICWSVRCYFLPWSWDPPVWEDRRSFGWAHPSRSQFFTHEGLGGSLKEKHINNTKTSMTSVFGGAVDDTIIWKTSVWHKYQYYGVLTLGPLPFWP